MGSNVYFIPAFPNIAMVEDMWIYLIFNLWQHSSKSGQHCKCVTLWKVEVIRFFQNFTLCIRNKAFPDPCLCYIFCTNISYIAFCNTPYVFLRNKKIIEKQRFIWYNKILTKFNWYQNKEELTRENICILEKKRLSLTSPVTTNFSLSNCGGGGAKDNSKSKRTGVWFAKCSETSRQDSS